MKKRFLFSLVLLMVLLALVLALVMAFPAHASTTLTLQGPLSWNSIEGPHVEMSMPCGHTFVLVGATPAIQASLETGANAGKRACVRGCLAEVSIFGKYTLIVHQVILCHH